MSAAPSGLRSWRALLAFELMPSLKGPLLWAALAGLALLTVPVRIAAGGAFTINGQLIGQESRLGYVLVTGHSWIVFLTTLLTLCLCLDRTGAHYLRNNDLLVLSRSVGRGSFYLAKMASVLVPAVAFAALGLIFFWEELYRSTGISLHGVFLLLLPLSLAMLCQTSLYFLMRNYMGNFLIFFLWLLILPFVYGENLWRHFAPEALRGGAAGLSGLRLLPQFGGVHAHSLGMVHDSFVREGTGVALLSCVAWTAIALGAGLWMFSRKRL